MSKREWIEVLEDVHVYNKESMTNDNPIGRHENLQNWGVCNRQILQVHI